MKEPEKPNELINRNPDNAALSKESYPLFMPDADFTDITAEIMERLEHEAGACFPGETYLWVRGKIGETVRACVESSGPTRLRLTKNPWVKE